MDDKGTQVGELAQLSDTLMLAMASVPILNSEYNVVKQRFWKYLKHFSLILDFSIHILNGSQWDYWFEAPEWVYSSFRSKNFVMIFVSHLCKNIQFEQVQDLSKRC